jgi:fibronectin type 3 domain-containing protein
VLQVPDAIEGLQATATEKAIVLSWKAPDQPVTAYRLFRSPTGKADSFRVIAETSGLVYHDSNFEFGRSYFYRISALVQGDGSTAASEASQPVEITLRDTFSPKPPQGLTAVYTTEAVELIWSASSEVDLRGYMVYRREEGLSQVKVTPEPLSTPIFRDRNVTAGKNYTYRVTAVDSSGNESDFSEEATAEVR